jgi:hypothetical protein
MSISRITRSDSAYIIERLGFGIQLDWVEIIFLLNQRGCVKDLHQRCELALIQAVSSRTLLIMGA